MSLCGIVRSYQAFRSNKPDVSQRANASHRARCALIPVEMSRLHSPLNSEATPEKNQLRGAGTLKTKRLFPFEWFPVPVPSISRFGFSSCDSSAPTASRAKHGVEARDLRGK